jgi:hypothetical protein
LTTFSGFEGFRVGVLTTLVRTAHGRAATRYSRPRAVNGKRAKSRAWPLCAVLMLRALADACRPVLVPLTRRVLLFSKASTATYTSSNQALLCVPRARDVPLWEELIPYFVCCTWVRSSCGFPPLVNTGGPVITHWIPSACKQLPAAFLFVEGRRFGAVIQSHSFGQSSQIRYHIQGGLTSCCTWV